MFSGLKDLFARLDIIFLTWALSTFAAWAVPEPPRDEPALPGAGVDVPAGHLRVLPRGRQETPGDRHQRPQDGAGRLGPAESSRPPLRHVRQNKLRRHRPGNADIP